MTDEQMTEAEWRRQEEDRERARRDELAAAQRAERERRKAHEATDLTDTELAKAADHHLGSVEQWDCQSCTHGRTCLTGRLIREVRRRRAEAAT